MIKLIAVIATIAILVVAIVRSLLLMSIGTQPNAPWLPPEPPRTVASILVAQASTTDFLVVYVDITGSARKRHKVEVSFAREAAEPVRTFCLSSTPGSTVELYVTGEQPGLPRCVFCFTVPANRIERRLAADKTTRDFMKCWLAATDHAPGFAATPLYEDVRFLVDRAVQMGERSSLDVVSDGEQWSEIARAEAIVHHPAAALRCVMKALPPPQGRTPDQITFIQVPHAEREGKNLNAGKYRTFFASVSRGWGIPTFNCIQFRSTGAGF